MSQDTVPFPALVCTAVANGIQWLRILFGGDDFAFIVNGTRVAWDVLEAVFLSPTIADWLLSDGIVLVFLASDAICEASELSSIDGGSFPPLGRL
jgi:hypothetical protein